jgi:hypothetical protein
MNYNTITFLREYNLNNSRDLHYAGGYAGECSVTYCVNLAWQSKHLNELEPISGRYAGMGGWMSRMVRRSVLRKCNVAT